MSGVFSRLKGERITRPVSLRAEQMLALEAIAHAKNASLSLVFEKAIEHYLKRVRAEAAR